MGSLLVLTVSFACSPAPQPEPASRIRRLPAEQRATGLQLSVQERQLRVEPLSQARPGAVSGVVQSLDGHYQQSSHAELRADGRIAVHCGQAHSTELTGQASDR